MRVFCSGQLGSLVFTLFSERVVCVAAITQSAFYVRDDIRFPEEGKRAYVNCGAHEILTD